MKLTRGVIFTILFYNKNLNEVSAGWREITGGPKVSKNTPSLLAVGYIVYYFQQRRI